jgi:rubrerythrin
MKTYICEICGDAYVGNERPTQCPFCGAKKEFIKEGKIAKPIMNGLVEISVKSRENLMKTLELEMHATSIYQCMATKATSYEIKAMYKRLAKIELEHAVIVTKLLKIERPEVLTISCPDSEAENFKETIVLEDNASKLYVQFAREATEAPVKKFFGALTLVEREHLELIKGYLG